MQTISIPYDTGAVELHIAEENLAGVLTARTEEYRPALGETELVRNALKHPIGTPPPVSVGTGKTEGDHRYQRPHTGGSQQDYPAASAGGGAPRKPRGGDHHLHCHWTASPHNGGRAAPDVWGSDRGPGAHCHQSGLSAGGFYLCPPASHRSRTVGQ